MANKSIDLTQFDDDFQSETPAERSDMESVPDGKYQVVVEKVEIAEAHTTGNPMLKWTLRVLAPRYVNRLMWRNSVFTAEHVEVREDRPAHLRSGPGETVGPAQESQQAARREAGGHQEDQGRQREHLFQQPHRKRPDTGQVPAGGGGRACPVLASSRATIIIDTREQEPYSFDPRLATAVRRALPAGDYSVDGLEACVAVERKSLDDFVSTVIHSRERFRAELQKLAAHRAACVVVEAGITDILQRRYRGEAHPNAVLGNALSIILDYRIPVFFCSNRQAACHFVQAYLLAAHARWST